MGVFYAPTDFDIPLAILCEKHPNGPFRVNGIFANENGDLCAWQLSIMGCLPFQDLLFICFQNVWTNTFHNIIYSHTHPSL